MGRKYWNGRNALRARALILRDETARARLEAVESGKVVQLPNGTIVLQDSNLSSYDKELQEGCAGAAVIREKMVVPQKAVYKMGMSGYYTSVAYCLCQILCKGPRCARNGMPEERRR